MEGIDSHISRSFMRDYEIDNAMLSLNTDQLAQLEQAIEDWSSHFPDGEALRHKLIYRAPSLGGRSPLEIIRDQIPAELDQLHASFEELNQTPDGYLDYSELTY